MQEENNDNKKRHHDPKVEEGRDYEEEKTDRVKAARGPRTTILD